MLFYLLSFNGVATRKGTCIILGFYTSMMYGWRASIIVHQLMWSFLRAISLSSKGVLILRWEVFPRCVVNSTISNKYYGLPDRWKDSLGRHRKMLRNCSLCTLGKLIALISLGWEWRVMLVLEVHVLEHLEYQVGSGGYHAGSQWQYVRKLPICKY